MNNQLTPMQEFINALTENGLISINQTLIDGALRQEKQVIEDAYDNGWINCNAKKYDSGNNYYNTKFKQNESK